jgi:hypothetical protein
VIVIARPRPGGPRPRGRTGRTAGYHSGAAGIAAMVGHHIGMFEFDTLAAGALEAALADSRTRMVWHRRRTDHRYELTGNGGWR